MVEPSFTPQLTRLERQLSVTLGLASLSTETKGVAHFVARCLELLARSYGFVIAQYWTVDASQETVQCSDVWFSLAAMPDFRRASKERRMSKGVGLPGRAWGIGAPIYVPHLESEMGTRFPRKEIALRVGLTSGFAFPVKTGPRVRSVFEFYSFETIEENAEDLRFFEKLGCVIGGLIEEKQEQENTNYQERFYDAIIRNCPQAIIAIDAHGLVTHWNRQAEHFFAWSLDEAVGRQLGDLIIRSATEPCIIKVS